MLKIFEYLAVGSALAFAICLIALMFFYGSPPASSESPQQQNAEENKAVKNQGEAEKPFWEKATTDPVAAFTLFLVIFTAVLSAVGVIQLKMLVRAETLAEKSAQAAKDSAEAALKQIDLMKTDQRPWISLDMLPEGPLVRDVNGWNFIVRYTLNNAGKSPAFNVDFIAVMVPLAEVQPNRTAS